MPVDAELQPVLDLLAAMEQPPPMEAGPDAAREGFALLCAAFGPGAQDVTATDITLAGADGPIPGRIYRPAGAAPSTTGAAGLVFLHGGGFVIGSLDTHDALCRDLA
ncbi:MAG TPA: alpha/beta hydrolase fold domain-containing protein, partial [Microthrixaceae bacterium]|nr:alpha/beta hydrolase fold domain-containing protein [Microthrixaceae bacterium]